MGHSMAIIALVLFGLASSRLDSLFLPSFLLLGLGGAPIQLAALPLCNEFTRHAPTALATYSGLYTASALIFSLFLVSKCNCS